METNISLFWEAFHSRDDLSEFGADALLLFALQMRFGIEDILTIAENSLTEGSGDKKVDLVYIDSESEHAVIAQAYMSESMDKKEAPANKASDLNTAVSWLLSPPINDLPESIKSHAEELRQAINKGLIKYIYIWYVHNLPESVNVKNELATVEHTANAAIKAHFPSSTGIEIQAVEVGTSTLEQWYKSILTPILVSEEFTIPISGGFEISDADWKAYVTSIPAKWLYEQFQSYKTMLFSANVRDYLGSRKADPNINNGIKETANDDSGHFWVYNNGITVLVHKFEEKKKGDKMEIYIKGFAIVNGSQTTGAIGSLEKPPADNAKVQVRFITCNNQKTLHDIVKYNNSQNKITAPDFRSGDRTQIRLVSEFRDIPPVEYVPRRGGYVDVIKRRPNLLPSVTAGQALAAFHGKPDIAYHEKTHMWEDDKLYTTYFGDQTKAEHIIFAYSLLRAVENKKLYLRNKSKNNSLLDVEKKQLEFFRKRGSTFLMTSAIAKSLETFLNKPIPNLFSKAFKSNLSPEQAIKKWAPIVEVASAFTASLVGGLADGFKTHETVYGAIGNFQNLIASVKQANAEIFAKFASQVN
jgi:hypothetical protein